MQTYINFFLNVGERLRSQRSTDLTAALSKAINTNWWVQQSYSSSDNKKEWRRFCSFDMLKGLNYGLVSISYCIMVYYDKKNNLCFNIEHTNWTWIYLVLSDEIIFIIIYPYPGLIYVIFLGMRSFFTKTDNSEKIKNHVFILHSGCFD